MRASRGSSSNRLPSTSFLSLEAHRYCALRVGTYNPRIWRPSRTSSAYAVMASSVMRPTFGTGLRGLIFEPLSTSTRALVRHRVEQGLLQWEPRIDIDEVRVTADDAVNGKLLVEIDYSIRSTNTFYNLVYPFYLQEGTR